MTRTQHFMHPTKSFPVYCLDWTDERTVLLGGGGGASRSGIANKFKLAKVTPNARRVEPLAELVLSSDEDAPMTLALDRSSSLLITGINGSQAEIEAGRNPNCRVFSFKDNVLEPVRSQQTIKGEWSDDFPYQKLTALSDDGAYVAVGSTDNRVAVLRFPSLEIIVPPFAVEGGDIVDLSWGGPSGLWLAVTTAAKAEIYAIADREKATSLVPVSTVPAPASEAAAATLAFRSVRFAPHPPNARTPPLLAVLNSSPSRKDRKAPRKAFVAKFDAVEEGEKAKEGEEEKEQSAEVDPTRPPKVKWTLVIQREVARKPITVFDVSADGRLVAFGSSDLSIGMLDAKTLAPLLKILQAHSFPPTALKFNPTGTLLVSASADNTIRTVVVPASFGGAPSSLVIIIFAILILIIAFLLGKK